MDTTYGADLDKIKVELAQRRSEIANLAKMTVADLEPKIPVLQAKINTLNAEISRLDSLISSGGANTSIYKNGSQFGAINGTGSTFSQNLIFASGDSIELWGQDAPGNALTVSNFRIYANQSLEYLTCGYSPVYGIGAPSSSAFSLGQLYIRLDGISGSTLFYIKTGASSWTAY